MSTSPNFSARELEKIVCPPGKPRLLVRDPDVPGLYLFVLASGARAFYWYRKVHGRPEQVRLGGFDELTVRQAREMAAAKNNTRAQNLDPAEEKRKSRREAEQRRERTLGALWQDYYEKHAKLHKRGTSAAEDERLWKRYLEPWAKRSLDEIARADVEHLHTAIGTGTFERNGEKWGGTFAANRMLALLSAMFRKRGEAFGLPAGYTPTAGVRRFSERPRERVLEPDELRRFLAAVDGLDSQTMRDFLKLCLFTGARRGNVMAMRWEDVKGIGDDSNQLLAAEWRIPGEMTKGGKPLRIPLVPDAVAILHSRPHTSPYVFPAREVTSAQVEHARALRDAGQATRQIAAAVGLSQTQVVRVLQPGFETTAETRPMQSPGKAMDRACAAAGIGERTTLHDLRRTWITAQVRAGGNMAVVSAAAGHRTMATTLKHYAIAGDKAVRASVTAGISAMLSKDNKQAG